MEPSYLMTSFTVTPKPNIRFANLQNFKTYFLRVTKNISGPEKIGFHGVFCGSWYNIDTSVRSQNIFYLIPVSDFISVNFLLKKLRPCLYILLAFLLFFLNLPFLSFFEPNRFLRPFFLILLILLQILFASFISFIDPARSLQHIFNISLLRKNCISQKCKNIICSTCRAASHLFLWVCSDPALSCRLLWT